MLMETIYMQLNWQCNMHSRALTTCLVFETAASAETAAK